MSKDDDRIERCQASVSIIIPCYNCGDIVGRAIKSIFDQIHTAWELLLVDNNSTDKTADVLEEYRQIFPDKIKVLYESRQGAPAARNRGLYEARFNWIQFLDADDELMPDKLNSQIIIASNYNKACLVASPYTMRIKKDNHSYNVIRELETGDFWLGLIRSKLGITSANLWRKEALLNVGGWDEALASSQEYDLMFRMLKTYPKVGFDPRNLTIIHIGSGESVSRGGGKEKGIRILESRIGLRLRIKEYLCSEKMLTPIRLHYLDRFIYKQLYTHYRVFPDLVVKKLKTLELRISLKDKWIGKYFMLKMDLKKILKPNQV